MRTAAEDMVAEELAETQYLVITSFVLALVGSCHKALIGASDRSKTVGSPHKFRDEALPH